MALIKYKYFAVITLCLSVLLYGCGGGVKFNPNHKPKPLNKNISFKKKKFALVLGGGGAKGFAHVGVLEELHNAGLKPDIIIGCSAGSIVGSLYAADPNIENLKTRTLCGKSADIVAMSVENWPYSVYSQNQLARYLDKNLVSRTFYDLKIPFVVTATNLQYGEITAFSEGDLTLAVMASASYPGVFSPVLIDEQHYIDCGVSDPLPTRVAKELGFEYVIAVNIAEGLPDSPPNHAFGVMQRGVEIAYVNLLKNSLAHADVVIDFNFKNVALLDDSQNMYLYEQGKIRARQKLPEIMRLLTMPKKKL